MFGIGKNKLVRNLCRLAAHHCSYSKQPCDCKYINDTASIATMSEQGSGCPEITMAAMLLSQLSAEQFATLAKQAGVTLDEDGVDVVSLIVSFQEQRMSELKAITSFSSKSSKRTKKG
jgi:hypothetical protein